MAVGSREPANASLFVESELPKQIAYARNGILNPSVETLSNQRYAHLYRLGHSSLSDEENLSSPWWSDFQSYIALKAFAETNSISLTISSRVHNAQTPEFGPADVLYKAALAAPLMVLQGLGRPVMAADGRIYSPPHAVTQTFVPGLRAWPNKIRSKIWRDAFLSYTKQPVGKGMISLYGE
jgi:hypothetical protein